MAQTWTLSYLLTDHLGSVVAITDDQGDLISQQRYLPFGGVRTIPNSPITNTDYGYTGQRNLDEGLGLMDYKARFYSPMLNRFIQPDSIVPNAMSPQMFNRFGYVGNNPINFNDPTGHLLCDADGYCDQQSSINQRNSGNGRCMGKCPSPKPKKEKVPICSSRACDPNIPTREEVEEFFYQCEKSLWSLSGCTSSNFTVPEINEPIPHELGLACVAPPFP